MDDNKIKYEENSCFNREVGVSYGSDDNNLINGNPLSDISKANTSTELAELPDIPLPLKDGFLKEFWDILWIKYKEMYENLKDVKLDD